MAIPSNISINDLVNAYNKNKEYVYFNESNEGKKVHDLGYICLKEGETTNAIESTMIPFDPLNKYMKKQADYNLGMFYSDLKFQEEEHINKNPLSINDGLSCIIVPGYFDDDYNYFINNSHIQGVIPLSNITDFSSLSAATNKYTGTSNFSVEWFGYFKPKKSGTYVFATISDDSSLLWIGEEALISYNMNNLNVNNRGKHGNQIRGNKVDCEAGKLYPIRIQYGQASGGQSFQLLIYKLNKDAYEEINHNHLKTAKIGDSPYEPIQIFYSIKNNNGGDADLGAIFHTKYDINNNYVNNQALRLAKANPKLVYTDIVIAEKADSVTFNAQGYLMAGSQNLTGLNNESCSGLATPSVTMVSINSNDYTKSSQIQYVQRKDTKGKDITWIVVRLPRINVSPWYKKIHVVIYYTLSGNDYTYSKQVINGQNISFSVQNLINECKFIFELSNKGELAVLNTKKNRIWSSFQRMIARDKQKIMNNAVVNNAWLKDNQRQVTNLAMNETLSANGLISQDGRFKLVVNKENNLVLRYCTEPGPSTATGNIHRLYGVPHNPFRGKTFLANKDKKTLRYIPIAQNGIIGFTNTYKTKDANSPSTFGKNYKSSSNIKSQSDCKSICNKNEICSHFWFDSNKNECNINTDGSHPYIYPQQDKNLKQITLGIRDRKVNSECDYSKPPYINNESIIGLNDHLRFAEYKVLPKVNADKNARKYEGPCSDPAIMMKTKSLESKLPEKFTNLSHNTIENMVGYNSNAGMGAGNNSEKNKHFLRQLDSNVDYLVGQNAQITQNNRDISNNYAGLNEIAGTFGSLYTTVNNTDYDVVDSDGNLLYDKTNPLYTTTQDVLLQDNKDILVQQNLMYMVGAIAAATCLVGALVIGQE